MAIEIMTLAWDVRGITSTQKLVLMDLADSANRDTCQCWPSVERIVERTGAGRRTVFEALDVLEDKGLIKRDQRANRSTMYTVTLGAKSAPGSAPPAPVGAKSAPLEVRQPHTEPSVEPPLNRQGNQAPDVEGLDREAWFMWVAYRKDSKRPLRGNMMIEAQARKLAKFGIQQMTVVQQSIEHGWQGLFEIKTNTPASSIPSQLWDADIEQWVSTNGLPKWKLDKLLSQAASEKAFASTFVAGPGPTVRSDQGASR